MAQHQPGNNQGITDPKRATAGSVSKSDGSVANSAVYDSNEAMDTHLLTKGYTQTQLDSMNNNDKMYAIRLADDATTF